MLPVCMRRLRVLMDVKSEPLGWRWRNAGPMVWLDTGVLDGAEDWRPALRILSGQGLSQAQ
jgi:hypothetical protein